MLGCIERCHLNRRDWLEALCNRVPNNAVHVTVMHQRSRVAVVGAENEIATVYPCSVMALT